MFEEMIAGSEFKELMKKHSKEILEFVLASDFKVVANLESVKFSPELPQNIRKTLNKLPVILFELANYTLDSATLDDEGLKFEAGFGEEDFASTVTIPYLGVIQIVVDDKPIFINLAVYDTEDSKREKSKKIFSSLN